MFLLFSDHITQFMYVLAQVYIDSVYGMLQGSPRAGTKAERVGVVWAGL